MSNHHRAIEIARDYSNKLPIFPIILTDLPVISARVLSDFHIHIRIVALMATPLTPKMLRWSIASVCNNTTRILHLGLHTSRNLA